MKNEATMGTPTNRARDKKGRMNPQTEEASEEETKSECESLAIPNTTKRNSPSHEDVGALVRAPGKSASEVTATATPVSTSLSTSQSTRSPITALPASEHPPRKKRKVALAATEAAAEAAVKAMEITKRAIEVLDEIQQLAEFCF
jgi:hypothetical protein